MYINNILITTSDGYGCPDWVRRVLDKCSSQYAYPICEAWIHHKDSYVELYASGFYIGQMGRFSVAKVYRDGTVVMTKRDYPQCDNSYHMWGGELRDRLPRGARYYQRGKRW